MYGCVNDAGDRLAGGDQPSPEELPIAGAAAWRAALRHLADVSRHFADYSPRQRAAMARLAIRLLKADAKLNR